MEDPLHDPLSAGGVAHLLVPSESADALDVAGAGEVALALVATLLKRRKRTSFGVRGARQGEGKIHGKVKGHTTRPEYFTHVVQHLVPEVLLLVCEVSVGGVRGAAGPEEGHAGGAPHGSGLRGHDVHRGRAQSGQGAEGRPLQQGGGHSPHQGSHGRLRRGPEQLRREREQHCPGHLVWCSFSVTRRFEPNRARF